MTAGSAPAPRALTPAFTLVTGNPDKVAEAERILGFRPPHADVDLPEIQSLDIRRVVEAKGDEAWRRLGVPLVVEETGLELDALAGFPGPLVRWMLEAVGPEGIARTADRLGDPRATARCLLLYRDTARTVVAEGVARGELAATPSGARGFGWDVVFRPSERPALTFAELPPAEKDALSHRGRAWRALLAALRDPPPPSSES